MIASTAQSPISPLLLKHQDLLACPVCRQPLKPAEDRFLCASCPRTFMCEEGIPRLFWPNRWDSSQPDVTDIVKTFYEDCPFPNYEGLESSWSLGEKARASIFARLLDEQLAHGATILEAGCGTGQLSNFLGSRWGRTVIGTDLCINSLRLGDTFRKRNQLEQVAFLQMNLFQPVFKPQSFDLVISNGVLHHTSDPERGFRSIADLVKVGGVLIVGLYNTYGRMINDFRRRLYRVSGSLGRSLDPRLRDRSVSDVRKQTWFADQYQHPHESKHTFGEVLRWFDRAGFEFLNSIPKAQAFEPFTPDERLFGSHPSGSRLDHAFVQLGMLLTGGKEGGFFTLIAKKEN